MDDARQLASSPAEVCAGAHEVVIPGKDGLPLHGTLGRPPAAPAMLLLQGSGPVDRDGNIPGVFETDLLKQLAEALARAGVVSLRYDKRGEYANKAQLPKDKDELAAFLAWDNFVGDAAAAWRFLRDEPGVDRQRVGFFGHSEGGIVALAAAHQLLDAGEAPAVMVLAATPGRPMGEVVRQQIEQVMKRSGIDPAKAEQIVQTVDRIEQEIAQAGELPEAVPGVLKPLYRPELVLYWQQLLRLDPARLAKMFPGPVLIIDGTADKQVSARDDALTLDAALTERPADNHDLLIVPRVSHELKEVKNLAFPDETGPIKPSLVNEMVGWVKKKLIERQ